MEKINLNEMDKEIMKKYSDKLVFFTVKVPIQSITNKNAFWLGKDYHEFFDIAVKVGVKMIYCYKITYISIGEKFAEHAADIAELDFGFMHDGIMHVLIAYSDQYSPAKMTKK